MLKEVAGTKVYEQRRAESTRLIAESGMCTKGNESVCLSLHSSHSLRFLDAKRSKIDELLKYIQEKLGELEEEKDELDQYQTLDRERRSLEYTIYARELADANRKLEDLEENRARDVETSAIKQQQLADNETSLSVRHSLPLKHTTCTSRTPTLNFHPSLGTGISTPCCRATSGFA